MARLGLGAGIAALAAAAVLNSLPVRQISTRTQSPGVQSGGSQKVLSATYHDALSTVTRLRIGSPNWYVDTSVASVEINAGSACTWSVGIEYPAGVITNATFSGSATGVIADGETGLSDWINVYIPEGARFRVWQRKAWSGSGKAVYSQAWADDQGIDGVDRMIIGPGGDASNFGDDIASTAVGFTSPPVLILGETNKNAIGFFGDSNDFGTGDSFDATGLQGAAARLFGTRVGYVNASRGGENTNHFIAGHAKRVALADYCNIIYLGFGTNDLGASFSSAATQANLNTIAAYFPGKPKWCFTDEPRTQGAWTNPTGADQAVFGNESDRIATNTWRRTTPAPFSLYVEYADTIESARNSGLWKAPGYTADGIHASQTATKAILTAGFDMSLLGPAVTAAAPVCQKAPTISGTAQQGQVLSFVDYGLWWSSLFITFTYQWKRNGANITGATASTYTLQSGDLTKNITCAVVGTNSTGASAPAATNAVGPIAGAGAPTIAATSGSGYAGSTYTASPGDSSTAGQWYADGAAISGQIALTFVMTTSVEGASVTFKQGDGVESNAIHLFVPGDLGAGLVSHMDALSTATITQTSGAVTTWASRVGSHAPTQGTASMRPVYSATARNNKPGVTFDGVDDFLLATALPASFPVGSAAATIFTFGYADAAAGSGRLAQYGGPSTSAARYVGVTATNGYTVVGASSFNVNNGASVFRSADKVITARFNTGSISLNTDGNEIGTTSVTPSTTNSTGFYLGARVSGGDHFKGTLQENLIFNSGPTSADEQKVQGYLAHRWGRPDLLLSGHPYKLSPPPG